jgi:hypothetical protein
MGSMSEKIKLNKPITSLKSFFEQFGKYKPSSNRVYVYRGHPDRRYELKPAVRRKRGPRSREADILQELHLMHPDAFVGDQTTFERLVRMQHYGLPTRLLDVSLNPLVALYFTCKSERSKEKKTDGDFILISIPKQDVKYFDSHTVSVLANLSRLSEAERGLLNDISNEELNGENGTDKGRKLFEYILDEKPYFKRRIKPDDLKSSLLVKPKLNNPRIIAQQGAFILFGLGDALNLHPEGMLIEITPISAKARSTILQQLDQVNIHQGSLFPEIEKAASYIRDRLPTAANGTKSKG